MRKILVLDASQRSALAVTRSLGVHGVPTFTAEDSLSALAGYSKYSAEHFEYPSPKLYPEQFIEAIKKIVKQQHIEILMPMTELTTELLLVHKAELPDAVIPFSDINRVESLSNKCLLMKRAESLGVPVPRTWYVDTVDKLPCKLADLPYPIVLKPGKSWIYHEQQWRRAAVRFAENADDVQEILNTDWAFKANPFMLQETIDGHGAGVFALYNKGKPLTLFAHRRLREKPPSGGVSVLSESAPVDPVLGQHAETLLNDVNWHGVAMVEFKVDSNGTPSLMEINTRFWGSLQLAVDAGVDFPWLLYQLACDNQPEVITNFKTGVRLRWLLGDIDNLYLTLRSSHFSFKEKLNTIRRFLTPSPFKTRHEINRLSDLTPAWFELKQYLRSILK